MSIEFDKLVALLRLAEPAERRPRIDRLEAAKLAARWGWLARRAREQLVDAHAMPSTRATGTEESS
jgi:hypothetical protein